MTWVRYTIRRFTHAQQRKAFNDSKEIFNERQYDCFIIPEYNVLSVRMRIQQ